MILDTVFGLCYPEYGSLQNRTGKTDCFLHPFHGVGLIPVLGMGHVNLLHIVVGVLGAAAGEQRVAAGGGTSGFPREKSQTASSPNSRLSSMPFSNILRMKLEDAIDLAISGVTVVTSSLLRRLEFEIREYLLRHRLIFGKLLHALKSEFLGKIRRRIFGRTRDSEEQGTSRERVCDFALA